MFWFRPKRETRRQARQRELAEMEDRNREVASKVDDLAWLLDELKERKRGDNHP
ncbi:hypothetical protein [Paracoccus indicus]|uniref:hypothetical protein n=1 Tax=Paracoccus indicus TaxID=2079229 RepID=UPI0013B3CD2B|nr:hypothetical protein [Paracoccus indicus]